MKTKNITYVMETSMQKVLNRKVIAAALSGIAFAALPLAAQDAAADPAARNTDEARKAITELSAREKLSRQEDNADAEYARDNGRKLIRERLYQRGIDELIRAKGIWESTKSAESQREHLRDIEAMKKEIANAYYDWAKDLYRQSLEDAETGNIDKAISKCEQAKEMYPASADLMNDAIAKYKQKKRQKELAEELHIENADPEYRDRYQNIEIQLQRGRSFYKIGAWEKAADAFNKVINIDPYNDTAINYLRLIYCKIAEAGKARRDNIFLERVDEAMWKTIAPVMNQSADSLVDSVDPVIDKGESKQKNLREKLEKIKFKNLVFEETPLNEVIAYLRKHSIEKDEAKEGVNFVLRFEGDASGSSSDDEDYYEDEEAEEDSGEEESGSVSGVVYPEVTVYFGNDGDEDGDGGEDSLEISLLDVIKAICASTDLKYRVEDHAVVIAAKNVSLEDMITEQYPVDIEIVEASIGSTDPEDLRKFFQDRKIQFDDTAKVSYLEKAGALIVKNTPEAHEEIEKIIREITTSDPQIQVQVKFVEVNQSDLEELGFEYTFGRPDSVGVGSWQKVPVTHAATDGSGWVWEVPTDVIVASEQFENLSVDGLSISKKNPTYGESVKLTAGDKVSGPWTMVNGIPVVGETSYVYQNVSTVNNGRHTFGPNDRLVRNVADNYDAYGLDVARPDTIFGWNMTNEHGYTFDTKVHALDQADSSDILSSPRVTTMAGQSATIKMVTKKFYPDSWGDSEISTVDGIQVFVPSTPEFGEAIEEGLSLEVEPAFEDEKKFNMTMTMTPLIQEFVDWTDYSYIVVIDNQTVDNILRMPVIEKREVTTKVTCSDKRTIVLGGIVKDTINIVDDQYPILGDIPIIGRLFQSKGKNSEKTNLLIFLTARVVNSDGTPYRDEPEPGVPTF